MLSLVGRRSRKPCRIENVVSRAIRARLAGEPCAKARRHIKTCPQRRLFEASLEVDVVRILPSERARPQDRRIDERRQIDEPASFAGGNLVIREGISGQMGGVPTTWARAVNQSLIEAHPCQ